MRFRLTLLERGSLPIHNDSWYVVDDHLLNGYDDATTPKPFECDVLLEARPSWV